MRLLPRPAPLSPRASLVLAGLLLSACGGGGGHDADVGARVLVAIEAEAAGDDCANGGLRIAAGPDGDRDGTLAPEEATGLGYVCDAELNVALGRRFAAAATAVPAGAACAAGGQRIDLGHDDDADGVLEAGEIDSTIHVCGGAAPELLAVTAEPAGEDCPAGGSRIDVSAEAGESGAREPAGTRTIHACFPYVEEFAFTGSAQDLLIPAGVNEIFVEAWGAQGGGSLCADSVTQDDGGLGGLASGYLAVSPGQALRILVGGKGVVSGAGGFNGGGAGGLYGGGGGGATDLRLDPFGLEDRVLVAAGGGAGVCGSPDQGVGGAGGGLVGADGITFTGWPIAGGATETAGGAGNSTLYGSGTAGALGVGGGVSGDDYHISGGGGGYYGGGSAYGSGGGGGSSYVGGVASGATEGGQRAGDGALRLTLL